jgi:hypothetical protein
MVTFLDSRRENKRRRNDWLQALPKSDLSATVNCYRASQTLELPYFRNGY